MKKRLLDYLVCPVCNVALTLKETTEIVDDEIITGSLICAVCNSNYVIKKGIPRFVPESSYADSFGLQWNKFAATQQDHLNKTNIFNLRWTQITGQGPELAKNKVVLDAGCGAGPFVGLIADSAREVIAVDLSIAVEACYELYGSHPNVHVVQADLFKLPLKDRITDLSYSIGVLQHTPDPLKAFESILKKTKPTGTAITWNYAHHWWDFLTPRNVLRLIIPTLSPQKAYEFVRIYTPMALGVRRLLRKIPFVGKWVQKMVFLCDYEGVYPELNEMQLYEWALLDTYDALATCYEIRLPDERYIGKAALSGFVLASKGKGTWPSLIFEHTP